MRILMISDVYFPRINGVSTSIESFRDALANQDIEVRVVAPAYPAPYGDDASITRVPARQVPFDPEDRLMHSKSLRHTLSNLSPLPCDLVHVQTPFAAHYAGLRHARHKRLPCIATYHTHFEEYLYNYVPAVPKSALRSFARTLARRQCNTLDAVVVPSSAMQDTPARRQRIASRLLESADALVGIAARPHRRPEARSAPVRALPRPGRQPAPAHSVGVARGMLGIINAYASQPMAGSNAMIIAHELMHTLGATDKYDPATNLPRYPEGYAEPVREPRFPQDFAEIMGGRIPLSPTEADIPRSLALTLVGNTTAREIGWVKP